MGVLKDCARCMIYAPDGTSIATGEVLHTDNSIAVYFDNYNFNKRTLVTTVDFYDASFGIVRAVVELKIKQNSDTEAMPHFWAAVCDVWQVIDQVQRQKDVRARVYMEGKFAGKRLGSFSGVIRNISAGGMYINSPALLNRNEQFSCQLDLNGKKLDLSSVPLRAVNEKQDGYGYGCMFVDISDNDQATVREFVFKLLRADRQRRKNLVKDMNSGKK